MVFQMFFLQYNEQKTMFGDILLPLWFNFLAFLHDNTKQSHNIFVGKKVVFPPKQQPSNNRRHFPAINYCP